MGWGRDAPGLSHTGLSASFCSQQNQERERERKRETEGGGGVRTGSLSSEEASALHCPAEPRPGSWPRTR